MAYDALASLSLLPHPDKPSLIELGSLLPDDASYREVAQMLREVASESDVERLFGYGSMTATLWQREAAAKYIQKAGYSTTADHLLTLSLIHIFLNPGGKTNLKNDGPCRPANTPDGRGFALNSLFAIQGPAKYFSLRRLQGNPLFEKDFKKTPFVLFCLQRLFCRDYNLSLIHISCRPFFLIFYLVFRAVIREMRPPIRRPSTLCATSFGKASILPGTCSFCERPAPLQSCGLRQQRPGLSRPSRASCQKLP